MQTFVTAGQIFIVLSFSFNKIYIRFWWRLFSTDLPTWLTYPDYLAGVPKHQEKTAIINVAGFTETLSFLVWGKKEQRQKHETNI